MVDAYIKNGQRLKYEDICMSIPYEPKTQNPHCSKQTVSNSFFPSWICLMHARASCGYERCNPPHLLFEPSVSEKSCLKGKSSLQWREAKTACFRQRINGGAAPRPRIRPKYYFRL